MIKLLDILKEIKVARVGKLIVNKVPSLQTAYSAPEVGNAMCVLNKDKTKLGFIDVYGPKEIENALEIINVPYKTESGFVMVDIKNVKFEDNNEYI